MNDVATILYKEWSELRHNRMVLYIIVFVPLVLVAIPIGMLFFLGRAPVDPRDLEELGRLLDNPMFHGLDPAEAMQAAMANSFLVLFLIMPLMVPVTVAAYSIVGEKVTRSLEPLLATPISTTNLLVGKGLAAALPGIGMAWLAFGLFLLAARLLSVSDQVFRTFVDPMWLVAMFVLAPLLTVMAVAVGVIVSSRTTDPRAAEQLGSLVVLPLMVLVIGPLAGVLTLNSATFLGFSVLIAALDVVLVAVGVRLFRREAILTRWK